MPPRIISIAIILSWLGTLAWLSYERWLPWLRPNDKPSFRLELADEVAPEFASWQLCRDKKKIGSADTRMTPRKDGHYELLSKLRELETRVAILDVKIPLFTTTRVVNRQGELQSVEAQGRMIFRVLGLEVKLDGTIKGTIEGDQFLGVATFESDLLGPGKLTHQVEPIPIRNKQAFSPLQPLHKFPALRAGQSWIESNFDPVNEVLSIAIEQVMKKWLTENAPGQKLPNLLNRKKAPTDLIAEVQSESETLTYRGQERSCQVIVYKGEDLKMRTWVDTTDGRVLKQEASSLGEKMILLRE